MIKNITDASKKEFSGKRVLLRLDLNVPMSESGEVLDDFRIRKALPTINYLKEAGAKIRIISHAGSPNASLEHVAQYIVKHLNELVVFVPDMFHTQTKMLMDQQKGGDIMIFDNIRRYPGEELNDAKFAEDLADMADMYVNDAFSVSHREHASIIGVPRLISSYAGAQFEREIDNLRQVLDAPRPFVFVLGGAKFGTKLPLLRKFADLADYVVVGGAIANELLEEHGVEVGRSLTTEQTALHQKEILERKNVYLPRDVIVRTASGEEVCKPSSDVAHVDIIGDIGHESIKEAEGIVKKAKFVLWNGPMGNYEQGFVEGTERMAKIIAESTAQSVVGGGDTLAAIKKLNIESQFTFVSTGGGAMLDFLADETLVGIEALEHSFR